MAEKRRPGTSEERAIRRPDDRDRYRPKTPPNGTQLEDMWVGDTGAVSVIGGADDDTPVGLETLDAEADMRLRHRVKETNVTTLQLKRTLEATQNSLLNLRSETKQDVSKLEEKIDEVDAKVTKVEGKIDDHTGHVIRLVEAVGELKGTVGELRKNSDRNADRQMVTFEAHVEVDKRAKIANIEDGVKKKAWWRDVSMKAIGSVFGLLTSGAVVGYVVTHLKC